jgi:hypothetical protein
MRVVIAQVQKSEDIQFWYTMESLKFGSVL